MSSTDSKLQGTIETRFVNFDDDIFVTANSHVQQGLTTTSVSWAWTALEGYWHPLTWMSLPCQ